MIFVFFWEFVKKVISAKTFITSFALCIIYINILTNKYPLKNLQPLFHAPITKTSNKSRCLALVENVLISSSSPKNRPPVSLPAHTTTPLPALTYSSVPHPRTQTQPSSTQCGKKTPPLRKEVKTETVRTRPDSWTYPTLVARRRRRRAETSLFIRLISTSWHSYQRECRPPPWVLWVLCYTRRFQGGVTISGLLVGLTLSNSFWRLKLYKFDSCQIGVYRCSRGVPLGLTLSDSWRWVGLVVRLKWGRRGQEKSTWPSSDGRMGRVAPSSAVSGFGTGIRRQRSRNDAYQREVRATLT